MVKSNEIVESILTLTRCPSRLTLFICMGWMIHFWTTGQLDLAHLLFQISFKTSVV